MNLMRIIQIKKNDFFFLFFVVKFLILKKKKHFLQKKKKNIYKKSHNTIWIISMQINNSWGIIILIKIRNNF